MSNELLFVLTSLADIFFIFIVSRFKVEWLFATVIANLILVGIFGAKLITIFGLTTNVGNIFYACVFLATHFLLERYGKGVGMKTIWFGAILSLFFILMSGLATRFMGIPLNDLANGAILTLFSFSIRITFASILAFIFAQYINIFMYEYLKLHTKGKFLWLRSNVANIISQLVDSLIFFTIAFFDLPGTLLFQAILAGWLIKVTVVFMGTPFLYIDTYLNKRKL